jgi:NAD(P)-dependent dehydrogenase (short-subunit alcohol dehydrogenase family)
VRAIITGAASGIGRATAERLHAECLRRTGAPARLILVDRSAAQLEEVAAALHDAGAETIAMITDLVDVSAPARIAEMAQQRFGGLDALVSNAGILHRKTLLELSVEEYDQAFDVNTRPTFLLARATHSMLKTSRGAIVATTSLAAHEPTPSLGAYAPSKAALLMLIRQIACDWGPDGIRANTVSPGSTRTAIGKPGGVAAATGSKAGRNPLGIIAEPEDQAAAIVFLLGPDARFISGADLVVDGGARTQLMSMSGLARRED